MEDKGGVPSRPYLRCARFTSQAVMFGSGAALKACKRNHKLNGVAPLRAEFETCVDLDSPAPKVPKVLGYDSKKHISIPDVAPF